MELIASIQNKHKKSHDWYTLNKKNCFHQYARTDAEFKAIALKT